MQINKTRNEYRNNITRTKQYANDYKEQKQEDISYVLVNTCFTMLV